MCPGYIEKERWGLLTLRTLWQVSQRKGITHTELKALRESPKELHALFAQHVAKGKALTIHEPHVRRFMLCTDTVSHVLLDGCFSKYADFASHEFPSWTAPLFPP